MESGGLHPWVLIELANVLARQGYDVPGWVKNHMGKKLFTGQAHTVVVVLYLDVSGKWSITGSYPGMCPV